MAYYGDINPRYQKLRESAHLGILCQSQGTLPTLGQAVGSHLCALASVHRTNAISLGRHSLVKNGSSGL